MSLVDMRIPRNVMTQTALGALPHSALFVTPREGLRWNAVRGAAIRGKVPLY